MGLRERERDKGWNKVMYDSGLQGTGRHLLTSND